MIQSWSRADGDTSFINIFDSFLRHFDLGKKSKENETQWKITPDLQFIFTYFGLELNHGLT